MDNSQVIIRKARKADLGSILEMIQELADCSDHPDGVKLKVEDLIRDGSFNKDSKDTALFHSFVAEYDNKPIGFTIAYYTYSTWEGKCYYLEDLYVKPNYRNFGIGKVLFQENVKFAKESNCPRFDFRVLRWNPAKNLYHRLGAQNLTEKEGWELYRLEKADIAALVGQY